MGADFRKAMLKGTTWYRGTFPMSDAQLPPAMSGCYALDGVAGYIDISAIAPHVSSDPVSWGIWLKRDGAPSVTETVLAVNTGVGGNVLIQRIATGASTVSFVQGNFILGGTTHASTSCVDNEWHHHCCTWDIGGTGRLLYYLDGVLQFTSDVFAQTLAVDDTWSIGQEFDGATPSDFFTGKVARVSIFCLVLTAAQVAELAASQLPTTPAALGAVAIYVPGTHIYALPTIQDESSHGWDGVAVGVDISDYVEDAPQ